MGLSFERIDDILKSYGLVSHTIKNGKCTEYGFEDRALNIKKKNVATRVTSLINGGVGGYLYVGHLKE